MSLTSVAVLIPERFPLARFTSEQGAEMRHRVGPIHAPAHPAAAEALADDHLAPRLHRSRADLPTLRLVRWVVHPVGILADVPGHQAVLLKRLRPLARTVQRLQRRQDRGASLVLHLVAPAVRQRPGARHAVADHAGANSARWPAA